jgi:hypothetical protein
MHINSAAITNRKTGMAIAHQSSQDGQLGIYVETTGEKKAAIYTMVMINEIRSINPP